MVREREREREQKKKKEPAVVIMRGPLETPCISTHTLGTLALSRPPIRTYSLSICLLYPRWQALRKWGFWKHFADYFPMTLVKTCELPPEQNYLFGYHPHGVISMSVFSNFATESTGFQKNFPGITPHIMALNGVLRIPFSREILMRMGVCSVNRVSKSAPYACLGPDLP